MGTRQTVREYLMHPCLPIRHTCAILHLRACAPLISFSLFSVKLPVVDQVSRRSWHFPIPCAPFRDTCADHPSGAWQIKWRTALAAGSRLLLSGCLFKSNPLGKPSLELLPLLLKWKARLFSFGPLSPRAICPQGCAKPAR